MHTYLDRVGVAERIGVKPDSLSRYRLPAPDAIVGSGPKARKGWLPRTIDEWNAARPGRGWWGTTPTGKQRGGRNNSNNAAQVRHDIGEVQAQQLKERRKQVGAAARAKLKMVGQQRN